MKHIIQLQMVTTLFFISGLLMWSPVNAQENQNNKKSHVLKIMSYNLKFASPDFEPAWEIRREMQVDMIKKYDPDIIGTQEGLKKQVDYLMEHLPEYTVVGEGRKGGDDDEHMAIFIKRDRFRLREMSSFQLSETPEILGSGPENNPRMVTWARLAFINTPATGENGPYPQDYRGHWENTREFYLFNTHFFTGRSEERVRTKQKSAALIMERIRELDNFGFWTEERPVFLTGDFNSRPGGIVYQTFIGDDDSGSDSHSFLKDSKEGGQRIDWILYKGNVKVRSYEVVDYNVNGAYPSDHKPILVEFIFTDQ